MAITVFKAIWAFGHKTTAFLRSLFLFPFYAIPQAFGLFPGFRQTNQPALPFSNSRSASPSSRETRHSDDEMQNAAPTSAAPDPQAQKPSSVSKMVPALPRTTPAGAGKENRALEEKASADDTQLGDKLSRLELDESRKTATESPTPLQEAVNGTGSTAEVGAGKQVAGQNGVDGTTTTSTEVVTRALPVPLSHPFSQNSKPKEAAATTTTMQLDGVTVQVLAKAETPEQAAERAVHSRFMREALDMVSLVLHLWCFFLT